MLSFVKTSLQAIAPVRYSDGSINLALPGHVNLGPGQNHVVDFMTAVSVPRGYCAQLRLRSRFAPQLDLWADVIGYQDGGVVPLVATLVNKSIHISLDLLAGVEFVYLVVTAAYDGSLAGAVDLLAPRRLPSPPPPQPSPSPQPIRTTVDAALWSRGVPPTPSWWSLDDDDEILSLLCQSLTE